MRKLGVLPGSHVRAIVLPEMGDLQEAAVLGKVCVCVCVWGGAHARHRAA